MILQGLPALDSVLSAVPVFSHISGNAIENYRKTFHDLHASAEHHFDCHCGNSFAKIAQYLWFIINPLIGKRYEKNARISSSLESGVTQMQTSLRLHNSNKLGPTRIVKVYAIFLLSKVWSLVDDTEWDEMYACRYYTYMYAKPIRRTNRLIYDSDAKLSSIYWH